jgi:predicted nucleic-acid-binding protein
MRGVDTNVLLRFALLDHREQVTAVRRLMRDLARENEPIFVASIVFCEFVWVLRRVYKAPPDEIADALGKLLETNHLVAEHPNETREALDLYRIGPGDFADYLIGLVARSAGCRDTVTFDRSLAGAEGFEVL